MQRFGSIRCGQRPNPPCVGQERRSYTETHHVGQGIEFASKCTLGSHGTRNTAIHRVKQICDSDCDSRVVKIRKAAVKHGQYGVITAKHICNCKCAGKDVDTTSEAVIAGRSSPILFGSDGIYVVEFHFASKLSPPFTFCLSRTATSASIGSHTSTRDPNLIKPMRSPRETISPSLFQHITRRAIAPAICLNTKPPAGVATVIIFCSFSTEAAERIAA